MLAQNTEPMTLDLFAEDTSLVVDTLPNEAALASVATVGSLGCLTCPGSTFMTSGTASSQG
ncbi:thiocillin family RiPP [Streptomyces sp. NPDC020379]|uniref:thiocillin family RiPP n=1 Tax=Streptomyces sp. NPDC020379 TaxID=3365071 RepID=UPI0037971B9A